MNGNQINIIRETYAQIEPHADAAAEIFYARLFELRPTLRLLFPENLDAQKQKLMRTLGVAVENLDKLETLIPLLENLGRRHALYGVRDEYYETVGAALMRALSETLGERGLNAEAIQAWALMYAEISTIMRRAACELAVSEPISFQQEKKSMQSNQRIHISAFADAFNLVLFAIALIVVFTLTGATARGANFTVTNVNNSGNGSLREAITQANLSPNDSHVITFDIPGTGVKTITLFSPLPEITVGSLNILGITQPGYTNALLIELNGVVAGANSHGLNIKKGYVIVSGLIINSFAFNGINADPGNTSYLVALNVYGCYIGAGVNGASDSGNGKNGIYLNANVTTATRNNYISNIGGTITSERNVISGNNLHGIHIQGKTGNPIVRIFNNHIGTDKNGVLDIGNSHDGILITAATTDPEVEIGGTQTNQRNIISGNDGSGIEVGAVEPNRSPSAIIKNNYIGLAANGSTALGNADDGIRTGKSATVIGGSTFGEGNVISGNGRTGIWSYGKTSENSLSVKRNLIGTDLTGTADRGNALHGIYLQSPGVIGGYETGEGNVVSGNGASGIMVENNGDKSYILSNRIGVSQANAVIKNDLHGIHLNNTLGVYIGVEGDADTGNVIGGNAFHGIFTTGTSRFSVFNNFIGVTPTGTDIGNGNAGICVTSYYPNSSLGNGAGHIENNTIAFNKIRGVNIGSGLSGNTPVFVQIRRNSIYSNIGNGIDLNSDGVTMNDQFDSDEGANDGQNFPVITGASPTHISGTLNSKPNKYYDIEIFRVNSCDSSEHGEGREIIISTPLQTDAQGNGQFFIQGGGDLTPGQFITATATLVNQNNTTNGGETSEFSKCFTVTESPGIVSLEGGFFPTVNENVGTAIFKVNRMFGSFGTISVDYQTMDSSAKSGFDFAQTSGTLTFAPGEVSKIITVPIIDDNNDEGFEELSVKLSNPQGGTYFDSFLGNSSVKRYIEDNDNPPGISINDVAIAEGSEGAKNFTFNVALSAFSGLPIAVNYATSDGTANAPVDYTASSGTVNFAPGEILKTVTISVKGDTVVELGETFNVNLSNPTNATVSDGQGVGTIEDDDNAGKFSFSLAPYSAQENAQTQLVNVTRTNGDAGTVAVDYATQGGTATPNVDYTPASGTLVFNNGETTKTFSVLILNDQSIESAETIGLILSNSIGGATLGNPSTTVINILDDDSKAAIGGTVNYATTPANQPQKKVSGVVVSAVGVSGVSDTTDSSGNYLIENIIVGGQYSVKAEKTGNVNGISPFDANLILRHVASGGNGINALSANQQAAGDTDDNGSVTAFDATQILRFVAANGQNAATGQIGNWKFLPGNRQYQSMSGTLMSENYDAVLIGEVSGDWTADQNNLAGDETAASEEKEFAAVTVKAEDSSVIIEISGSNVIEKAQQTDELSSELSETGAAEIQLSLPENASLTADGVLTVPVLLNNANGRSISAYSFAVRFDSAVLQLDARAIETADSLSGSGFMIAADKNIKGRIGIAASAPSSSVTNSGTLLFLRFRVVGKAENSAKATARNIVTFEKSKNGVTIEDEFGNRISSALINNSISIAAAKAKDEN